MIPSRQQLLEPYVMMCDLDKQICLCASKNKANTKRNPKGTGGALLAVNTFSNSTIFCSKDLGRKIPSHSKYSVDLSITKCQVQGLRNIYGINLKNHPPYIRFL